MTNTNAGVQTTQKATAQPQAQKDYQQEAINLLNLLGVKFKSEYLKHDFYFDDDKQTRDIYRVSFTRVVDAGGSKRFSIKFGQSINNAGQHPTPYDVLACLQKYDVGSFADFCGEFGYDTDSRKAEKIYKAVCKEFAKVEAFFTPSEIEQLQEIN